VHWLPDVFRTLEIFVGGTGTKPHLYFFGAKPPMYQQKMNVDFIEAGTNFRWKERKPHFVNLSSYEVKSGDFWQLPDLMESIKLFNMVQDHIQAIVQLCWKLME
jgi:hypothetical protein